jgi:hypothetical protein
MSECKNRERNPDRIHRLLSKLHHVRTGKAVEHNSIAIQSCKVRLVGDGTVSIFLQIFGVCKCA